jgi:hypothetical protein
MPLFFLHMRSEDLVEDGVEDREGLFLEDAEAARREAIRSARDILCAELRKGRLSLGGQIEVADQYGQPILTVPFRETVRIDG